MRIHTHTHSSIYIHTHTFNSQHFRSPVKVKKKSYYRYIKPQSTKQNVRHVNENKTQTKCWNEIDAGHDTCRFNGHVSGTQTSAFIVFIDRARLDSLTPSAPSPGKGLKRTFHSSTNKLNKSGLVKQKKEPEDTENRHADTPSPM